MNQALGDQVAKILSSAGSACAQASAFVQERAPELCRQIVAWEIGKNASMALLSLLVFALLAITHHCARKHKYAEGWEPVGIFSAVFAVAALGFVVAGLYGCVKPLCAPDLVVLDYVRAFVK